MRFIGAALVFTAMTITGVMISAHLKKRAMALEKTLLFIGSMKLDFEYLILPLNRIVEKYALMPSYSSIYFISRCYTEMQNGEDFPKAWKKSVSMDDNYTQSEKSKLMELGDMLGTSDSSAQISILSIYEDYFTEFHKAALKRSEKYGESSVFMGLFLGAGAFILLI